MKIALFVNHRCNLRCGYCYNGRKFNRRMSWDIARRAVDLAVGGPWPRCQVSFFGGEPLLEMGLIRMVTQYARKRAAEEDRKVRFVITTNGTLLAGERLEYLLGHRYHLGVSLDGIRQAHDAFRRYPGGRSTHGRVTANLAEAVRRYPPVEVIAVVNPQTAPFLAESFEFIFGLGVRDVTFNMNYEADWDDAAGSALEEGMERLGDAYVAKARAGHHFTLNPIDSKIITRLKEGYSCADQCDFGCMELAVSPTGKLYPCERLVGTDADPKVQIGDIWNGVDPGRRDALRNAKNVPPDECKGCALKSRCMFWCGCVNYATTGRVNGVSGTLCWTEQLFIRTADRVARTLWKEQNPVFLERYYLSAGTAAARKKSS